MSLRIGIDIGSTTVKVVVLDEKNQLLFRSYERHYSKARERACETLRSLQDSSGFPSMTVNNSGRLAVYAEVPAMSHGLHLAQVFDFQQDEDVLGLDSPFRLLDTGSGQNGASAASRSKARD